MFLLRTRLIPSPSSAPRLRQLSIPTRSMATSTTTSSTPLEDSIRSKLTAALSPTHLQIHNDSAAHAHHAAMQTHNAAGPTLETHFRLYVVSAAFDGKAQPARHRLVYGLLREELAREGAVHALQLTTRTVREEGARGARERGEGEVV